MDKCHIKLDQQNERVRGSSDKDLAAPWLLVEAMAERQASAGSPFFRDVIIPGLKQRIEELRAKHRQKIQSSMNFASRHIQERQDILRNLSLDFLRIVKDSPEEFPLLDYLTHEAALTAAASYGTSTPICLSSATVDDHPTQTHSLYP